jgi:hypothetical protein
MRFSDMMGSGSERPDATEPSDGVIANALAPYIDAAAAVPPIPPLPPAPLVPVADRLPQTVAEPVVPLVGALQSATAAADPAPVLDFTPLSDDLLPRRR